MIDIETLIRDVLSADAATAPDAPPEWQPEPLWDASNHHRRPAPWLSLTIGLGAAACVAAGIIVISHRDPATQPSGTEVQADATAPPIATTEPANTTAPAPFVPAGTEYPLTEAGPAQPSSIQPNLNGVSQQVQLANGDQFLTPSLIYVVANTAAAAACATDPAAPSPCPRLDAPAYGASPYYDSTNSLIRLYWQWTNVPTDTAYVTFTQGGATRWQRPIAGLAVFDALSAVTAAQIDPAAAPGAVPDIPDFEEAIAYDSDGDILQRITTALPVFPETSAESGFELLLVANESIRQCLTDEGATFDSNNTAALPDGTDRQAVWDQCVSGAQQSIVDRLTQQATQTSQGSTG